ncbi:sex peptide receptor-like [Cherax quadricarinatus]|uniref:sex peptide receptor-like n=1 Tax=Cherax quadricarinatus TaxID=27406 RepID=UPI00387E9CDC
MDTERLAVTGSNVSESNFLLVNKTCGSGNATDFLNVSNLYPLDLAMPLYGYAMPVLLLVTTVANTIIVAVLGQQHMRSPTNAVLMAMALSDMLTVLFPEPVFFYMYTLNNHAKPLYPQAACYAWGFLHEDIPNLFHTASIWLTVALAVQRYIYVCHPPVARTWCTLPRVIKAIIWIFIFATIHQAPKIFDTVYDSTEVEWQGECVCVCNERFRDWVTQITPNIYFPIYFWFRVVFVHLGPCTVLVVLNFLLFRAMKEAQKRRKKLLHDKKSKRECKKLSDSNCTTLMLIAVVSVFLVTEIPLAVITLLHIISNMGIVIFSNDSYYMLMYFFIISNSFIIFSYPINFAIYCGMSRQFRETFSDLFIRRRSAPRRKDSTQYSTNNSRPRTSRPGTSETVVLGKGALTDGNATKHPLVDSHLSPKMSNTSSLDNGTRSSVASVLDPPAENTMMLLQEYRKAEPKNSDQESKSTADDCVLETLEAVTPTFSQNTKPGNKEDSKVHVNAHKVEGRSSPASGGLRVHFVNLAASSSDTLDSDTDENSVPIFSETVL